MRLVTGLMLMGSLLLSGTSGMVLCVDEGGHFAIEPASHDHAGCPHEEGACGHEDTDPSGEDVTWQSTGDCNDIPLDIQIASLVTKDLQARRLLMSAPVSPLPAGYAVASAFNAAYGRQHPPDTAMLRIAPSVLEKRTIVLRV